jgi:hypothetical protein
MNFSFKKMFNEYGIGAILILLALAYGIYILAQYLSGKGLPKFELNSEMDNKYKAPSTNNQQQKQQQQASNVRPSDPLGHNEVFSSAQGIQTSMPGLPTSCGQPPISNPAELLPKDTNSQWAQLNPSGKGELSNINLLKAGYNIGIDTIGQTLRNGNLQIRSEPPNPQINVGPWNQSTIEPDIFRVPFEIGSGVQ